MSTSTLPVERIFSALEGTPYEAHIFEATDRVVRFRVTGPTASREAAARRAQAHLAVADIYARVAFRGETGWHVVAKAWA